MAVIYMPGNNTRKLPVYLSLSHTSKNIMFFFLFFSSTKSENRRAEQVLCGSGTVGRGMGGESGQEDEYSANNVYTCM
jgi:hypothetical protein